VFDDLLREQQVFRFFRSRVWSSEIAIRKPHKAAYRHALRLLEVSATKTVVMVGDDETADIQAANQFGLTSVRIVHNGHPVKSKASHIVSDTNIVAFFEDLTA
jgi:FMN phosphatase YigB (HAD superfamily)